MESAFHASKGRTLSNASRNENPLRPPALSPADSNAWLVQRPIAHRGLYSNPAVPENSLSAFDAARRCHLPIECDVHLLADGRLGVIHDQNLSRLTGRNLPVAQLDAAGARQTCLLNTDQWLPLLEEVLDLIHGEVPLLIEL